MLLVSWIAFSVYLLNLVGYIRNQRRMVRFLFYVFNNQVLCQTVELGKCCFTNQNWTFDGGDYEIGKLCMMNKKTLESWRPVELKCSSKKLISFFFFFFFVSNKIR